MSRGPKGKVRRNAAIREAFEAGETMTAIGERYGISRQRVDQIVHRKRWLARSRFTDAVARGLIERPDECERCGAPDPHGHHPDYSKPLEVEWLCVACHAQEHAGPKIEREVRTCPVCGSEHERLPRDTTIHCSSECGRVSAGEALAGPAFDREPRVREVAAALREYVAEVGYIPGTTEFASAYTGRDVGVSTAVVCNWVDPNRGHYGSYAAVMDAIYEAAGFPRPRYGSRPLSSLESEAA